MIGDWWIAEEDGSTVDELLPSPSSDKKPYAKSEAAELREDRTLPKNLVSGMKIS